MENIPATVAMVIYLGGASVLLVRFWRSRRLTTERIARLIGKHQSEVVIGLPQKGRISPRSEGRTK
jgi:hypothetical protein